MTSSVSSTPIAEVATHVAPAREHRVGRHRFACFHVVATFTLLVAGAAVTSNDAGLSVRDWPSSLGFFDPIAVHLRGLMHGLVAIEHGHREIGMVVGLLTFVEAVWLWRTATRKAHRVLAFALALGVLAQGGLGGLTVKYNLPAAVSVAHGMLAQTFFALSIATAYVLSKEWRVAESAAATASRVAVASNTPRMRRAALVALGAVYGQLLLGAIVRHTVAKWRVPLFTDLPVALHMLFALLVLVAIGRLVAIVTQSMVEPRLTRPTTALGALVMLQLALGLLAIVTRTDPLVTVLHVVTGAAILGTALFLVLRTFRLADRSAS